MAWWTDAVVYQVYTRSFADGNGDGVGDLLGLEANLVYLYDLGVDAVHISAFYRSPLVDGGYDVADHFAVDEVFGDMNAIDQVIATAAQMGLRVIVDLVPNHCSDQHPAFQDALVAGRGSPERERFVFAEGTGPNGTEPPNDWMSNFGGPAWSRVQDGQWYLHLFDRAQPDWNWRDPRVRTMFEDVIRFWLDRGIAGLRVDSADTLFKESGLSSVGAPRAIGTPTPFSGQPELHDLYQEWRKLLDSYPCDVFPGPRIAIAEVLALREYMAPYLNGNGLPQAFNFALTLIPWSGALFRMAIDYGLDMLTMATETGCGMPWVLNNYGVTRSATRFGWKNASFLAQPTVDDNIDLQLGLRRTRAAALLMMALPGSVYVYQGEELGLPHVFDIPDEMRDDPQYRLGKGLVRSRDGCRVPLPWFGDEPPFGFTSSDRGSWLPQPPTWSSYTVEAQTDDPSSTLNLYRYLIGHRPTGSFEWIDDDTDVLRFNRGSNFTCVVNFGPDAVELPPQMRLLRVSDYATAARELPPDTAAWLLQ